MIKDLIKKNRSYRRFYQDEKIDKKTLEDLVELGRLSSSGANLQPLKYVLSNDGDKNDKIFKHLRWAGYLKDWDGPIEGERPSAYILILGDKEISKNFSVDQGIASQSILLGACEKGLGGCMFGAMDRKGIIEALGIPEKYELLITIALGKPKEIVVLKELKDSKDIKYWRDEEGIHYVPKRSLRDIILNL